jgi:hypothetical protein
MQPLSRSFAYMMVLPVCYYYIEYSIVCVSGNGMKCDFIWLLKVGFACYSFRFISENIQEVTDGFQGTIVS